MSDHALVPASDGKKQYMVPLIGVPEDAVTDTCDVCNKKAHIKDLEFVDGKLKHKDNEQCR